MLVCPVGVGDGREHEGEVRAVEARDVVVKVDPVPAEKGGRDADYALLAAGPCPALGEEFVDIDGDAGSRSPT